MAEKKDAKESKDTTPATAAAVAADAAPGDKKSGGGLKAWLPAIAAVILAPAATFAVAEFLLLPRLQAKLALPPADAHAKAAEPPATEPAEEEPAAEKGEKGEKGKDGKEAPGSGNYEFNNVVVNLAGTMGTRYLKTSFIVTGVGGKSVKGTFENQKAKLTDITLNVLSSLTLADLEEPGSKNVLREKLVAAYNQALGKRLVEQVYFSDFVIQ